MPTICMILYKLPSHQESNRSQNTIHKPGRELKQSVEQIVTNQNTSAQYEKHELTMRTRTVYCILP